MKKILLLTLLSIGLISCSNEEVTTGTSSIVTASLKGGGGNGNSSSSYSDFDVNVVVSSDGSLWTYTITKTKKNLSHFIIDLGNCGEESASFANIVYATVNGEPADLKPSEGSGTGCDPQASTTNFVKINVDGADSWVIVIQFDRGYEIAQGDSWIKAGTSCNTGQTSVPGCPREPYCSLSQGYFFANGALNNGSSALWGAGLTIGGVTYTQEQGMDIWSIDRGFGGNQILNGFFQLGAARLSGIEAEVQANADIIEAYFTAVGNVFDYEVTVGGKTYFDLPASAGGYTAAEVVNAGGAIGTYIDENHCTD